MKTQILSVAMISGFILIAADASAQRGADFGTLDTNNDGSLTLEEVQAAPQARFDAVDTDGSGALSIAELTAAAQSQAADRAEKMMARFDDNEDGALTIEEMRGNRSDRAERMFERIDANEDGVITEEEFAEMREGRGRGHGRGHGRGNK